LDSLLATVQMPPGIPVATMAIGKSGARNAGIFAIQIMAVSDAGLAKKLSLFKQDMARKVEQKAKNIERQA
jgi:phosphoribosylamine--glycine ligase